MPKVPLHYRITEECGSKIYHISYSKRKYYSGLKSEVTQNSQLR